MKRAIKYSAILVFVFVISAGVWLVSAYYKALNKFFMEDAVTHTGYQIVHAIDEYEKAHAAFPEQLDDLVPDYLDAIPSSEAIDEIDYTVETHTDTWLLRLHSQAFDNPRIFQYRSDGIVRIWEQPYSVGNVHGFEVLVNYDPAEMDQQN